MIKSYNDKENPADKSQIVFQNNLWNHYFKNYRGKIFRSCFQARITPIIRIDCCGRLTGKLKSYTGQIQITHQESIFISFFLIQPAKKKKKLRKKKQPRKKGFLVCISISFTDAWNGLWCDWLHDWLLFLSSSWIFH